MKSTVDKTIFLDDGSVYSCELADGDSKDILSVSQNLEIIDQDAGVFNQDGHPETVMWAKRGSMFLIND